MKSKAGARAALVGLLALVGVAGAVATADATAPGTNGKIAFRRYFDPAHESWGAVFTINPDGTGARQITHPAPDVLDDQPAWAPDAA